ncbi:hypothetical protein KIH74_07330 [Kineosporia sp. J2-2]|uniref:Uncharacterized protein n=1 Tax=Kineosporia corallincola TaxID=2835133 RepID=A0ABS5TCC3_9ACTN|nr:hypothetical protein [Kineosporia corallincola]MBT0768732.1 hypothetical protein [Kineosporia corallincola]
MTAAFATPVPTWSAIVAALDEDPTDTRWAFKLTVQCRDHLRGALDGAEHVGVLGSVDPKAWARDPGTTAPKRLEGQARPRRSPRDVPGGPEGPGGMYQPWHVLLGVLIGHEYEEAGREAPAWTKKLRMKNEWVMSTSLMSDQQVRSTAPEWLSERGIFISPRDLAGR